MDLTNLRAKLEATNTSLTSDTYIHTPLWVYLNILNKAENESYCSYMEGAKILHEWLSPIALPNLWQDIKIPIILESYELMQIAKIIAGEYEGYSNFHSYLKRLSIIRKTIYFTLFNDVRVFS